MPEKFFTLTIEAIKKKSKVELPTSHWNSQQKYMPTRLQNHIVSLPVQVKTSSQLGASGWCESMIS